MLRTRSPSSANSLRVSASRLPCRVTVLAVGLNTRAPRVTSSLFWPLLAAVEGVNARLEFALIEGFHQIVVRAKVQRRHPVIHRKAP